MVKLYVVFEPTWLAVPEKAPLDDMLMPVGKTPETIEYVNPLLVLVSPSQATTAVKPEAALLISANVPKLAPDAGLCQLGGALPPPRPCLEIIIYTSLFMILLIKRT
jgi:hypothetical protein